MAKNAEKKVENNDKKIKPTYFQYGSIIFGVGLLIALISSFLDLDANASKINSIILIILSIVIGIVNISDKESNKFMISSIVIIILLNPLFGTITQTLSLNSNPELIRILSDLHLSSIMLIAPAALVVAIKSIFTYAKDEN